MQETHRLAAALAGWAGGNRTGLYRVLGFEPVGLHVPPGSLADFGLDEKGSLALEIAARRDSYHIFRLILESRLETENIRQVAIALYRHNPTRRALLVFESQNDDRIVFASWGLGPGTFRLFKLQVDPSAPRRSELEILAGLSANGSASAAELAIAHMKALDREGVTKRFFTEFRRHRTLLATAITGVATDAIQDRLDVALTVLSRLLFLYFIQRKGWLGGDHSYLRNLFEAACLDRVSFYRSRLKPLFFGALNRPPERRGQKARELGDLPYLNGGLFERSPTERRHARLDIPNESFLAVFEDLLDKYQFTLHESLPEDQDVAVDPEMLGKVFEGLMADPTRGSTGTFYTPRSLVDRLVGDAIEAYLTKAADVSSTLIGELLRGGSPAVRPDKRRRLARAIESVRILDPAVGSGAFLLAVLQQLEALLNGLDGRPVDSIDRFVRRREIKRNLYGVDLNASAVRLCELRLWLALVVDLEVSNISEIPPLPNIDINVRQGDALVDPIDFLIHVGGLDDRNLAGRWRKAAQRLVAKRDRYFHSSGLRKDRLGRALRSAERDLAVRFLGELSEQIDERRNDLRAAAQSQDLFGRRAGLDRRQKKASVALQRRKREVRRLLSKISEAEQLPFFSFQIHFADPSRVRCGFDIIVGNPPWVRTHHWEGLPRARLKARFQFLRDAGWRAGTALSGVGRGFAAQLDLSALFLERSLGLLADGGVLGFLLPSKLTRSLSAGAVRKRLLDMTEILSLEDRSSAPNRLFEATTYPLALLLRRGSPRRSHTLKVHIRDRGRHDQEFYLRQAHLPLLPDDTESPWALAPPPVRAAIDRMREAGPPLGSRAVMRPRRGIVTGANDVLVGTIDSANTAQPASDCRTHDRDRVPVRFTGNCVSIESERLRPVLRGEDLAAWRYSVERTLIWTHDDGGHPLPSLPPCTRSYLMRHARRLRSRRDLKPNQPWWSLFRVDPIKAGLRVAWRDIGTEPAAVVIPPLLTFLDRRAPILSLNTVYQVPMRRYDEAHFLAAILNSTPARAFLKTIAQRASGGYFRFFASTVALLPLPLERGSGPTRKLIEISEVAHAAGGASPSELEELDGLVSEVYGLSSGDLEALRNFDAILTSRDGTRRDHTGADT